MKPLPRGIRPDGYHHMSDFEFNVNVVLWSAIWLGAIGVFIWAGVTK